VITRWVVRRLDDRLGVSPALRTGMNRVFPDHWSFLLGEGATYAFVYLLLSGTFLTFFFDPSTVKTVYEGGYRPLHGAEVSAAYASTVQLSWDVRFGLVVRQSHHWAALLFAGAVVVHLARVFFTGAFRRPRGVNWAVGVTLLLFTVVAGFTGYSLPDDLLSAMGLHVANSVLLSIPVIGTWLAFLVFGGEFPGAAISQRMYIAHVLLVPGLMAALIVLHGWLVVRRRHGQFPGLGRTETNVVGPRLWPARAVRSLGILFAVIALCLLLGGLVQINPVWLWGPYEPGAALGPAQPDWYLGWVDGALRLYPGWEPTLFGYRLPNMFVPSVLLPGGTFLALYLWPVLERLWTHDRRPHHLLDRPRDHPVRTGIGVMALTFYALLLTSWSLDVISRYTGIPVFTLVGVFRVGVLTVPLLTGAIALVLARGLRDSGADRLSEMSWSGLRAGWRRRREEDTEVPTEPAPVADLEQPPAMPEDLEPVRVEPGPVP